MLNNLLRLSALIYIASQISSCSDTKHVIDGESIPDRIDVVHTIELEDFEARFIDECSEQFETQEEIDQCVDGKVEDLLNIINGLLETDDGN